MKLMSLILISAAAITIAGCGDEVINPLDALTLQKPIVLTVSDDKKSRSLTDATFSISSAEPGQTYKQVVRVSNTGQKAVKILLAIKAPVWLDHSGFEKINVPAKKSASRTIYFVGDEEARGREGKVYITLGTQ